MRGGLGLKFIELNFGLCRSNRTSSFHEVQMELHKTHFNIILPCASVFPNSFPSIQTFRLQ